MHAKKLNVGKSASADGKGQVPRGRLLVVEDSESSRAMIGEHLAEQNFEHDEAENGAVAVEQVRTTRYDLILMDIMMPMMDGYEAMRRIRQWEEAHGAPRTPIIVFTGAGFEEDIQRALDAGADLHVAKPVKKEALMDAIERLIRREGEAARPRKHSA